MSTFLSEFSLSKTAVVLAGIAVLAILDVVSRVKHRPTHYALGVVLGTVLSLGLQSSLSALLHADPKPGGYVMALAMFLVFVVWRLLFGAWDSRTKATVLGTFVFWILFRIIANEGPDHRLAHLIAIAVAAVPAVVWSVIFLPYHRERLSVVFCMFFGGMLSTVPILFYDALVRSGTSLHFFLFRIELVSFNSSAHSFVGEILPRLSNVGASVMTILVSFLVVGIIEEGSKMWVLRRAGTPYVKSVDDMMQLAILVAIGFAFAENVTPSGYFVSFVRQYLLHPQPDWMGFIGNVAGRSVLTSMVHIVSTGMVGYFLGKAMLAGPYLRERYLRGRRSVVLEYLHTLFGYRIKTIYQREMAMIGYMLAVMLHATSNFLVTLPDVLPGNPHTLGDILGSPPGSPMHLLALLLFPALIYVVGGFFLLTTLFMRAENMKERGQQYSEDLFVSDETPL